MGHARAKGLIRQKIVLHPCDVNKFTVRCGFKLISQSERSVLKIAWDRDSTKRNHVTGSGLYRGHTGQGSHQNHWNEEGLICPPHFG